MASSRNRLPAQQDGRPKRRSETSAPCFQPASLPEAQSTLEPVTRPTRSYVGIRALIGRQPLVARGIQMSTGSESARPADDGGLTFATVVAESSEQIAAASNLVRRRYGWRGYDVVAADDDGAPPRSSVLHEFTIIALDRATTLGTVTLRLDGPAGLQAAKSYGTTIDEVRSTGGRVCELTRFAVAENVDSRTVVASLFACMYDIGRTTHGMTDLFVEVNPRHVAFYVRTLGFEVAAGERFCTRVGAPSVLLWLDLDRLDASLGIAAEPRCAPAWAQAA